ncbi:MAG: preprotein translocase subunit SecY [Candidatus Micrarchaeota archaeon]
MGVIDFVHSFSKHLPTIKQPERPVPTKDKLIWTGVALVIFFAMYHTTALGVTTAGVGMDFLQTITASKIGSLLTAGIGPIVLASIFLQLFSGAGIIKLDLKDKNDKQKFLETQKVLAILIAFAEGIIFVITGRTILAPLLGLPTEIVMILVVLQIAVGSIIIIYLDELVTKYGIGSGVSLFIAAGVSQSIIGGLLGLVFGANGVVPVMAEGGAEALPLALLALMPFIFTIIVFLAVVYSEGIKVEIPIAFERVRGMVPKLPLKFFYVSNIPVIFASALIMNIQLFAGMSLAGADLPFVGYVTEDGQLRDGLLYFLTPVYGFGRNTAAQWDFITTAVTPFYGIPEWVHALTYVLFLSLFSVLFGLFWVETSNMDAKAVAGQLTSSGMQIPGFRRDPRMLEKILHKNIFPLTVMGAFSVGLLAGVADLTGALGTGTGILLTVGILYRMYEQMEQMQAFELYPAFGKLIGE